MPQQFSNLPDYFTIKATHFLSLKVFTMKRNKKILLALTTSFHLISCTLDIKKTLYHHSSSLRWCTLLRRNIQELWQVSWNSYRISPLPCSPLWTTGCHGLTFLFLTVPKTSVPVQATTPTPCSCRITNWAAESNFAEGWVLHSKLDAGNYFNSVKANLTLSYPFLQSTR